MGVDFSKPMTLFAFLAWEARQEPRFEFDGQHPVAMADVTDGHDAIGGTLRALLHQYLRGKPCRVSGPTLKVEIAGRILYPDAFIQCKPVDPAAEIIREPVLVFDVVSSIPSPAERMARCRTYQAADSVQRIVLLVRDRIAATVFVREGKFWAISALADGSTLALPEIGLELELAAIYDEVALSLLDQMTEGPRTEIIEEAVKRMIARGRERGYVTYDELNAVLPQDRVSSEQIEDTMTMLSEAGVNVVESEESGPDPRADS